jgi:hypothetical protein
MTKTTAVTVRLDVGGIAMLDDIVALMETKAAGLGIKPTRSDAIRYCLTQWAFDHHETVERMLAVARDKH